MTQAIISLFSGNPICLPIQQDSTAQQLKEKIFQLTSIPVDQQVLRTVSGHDLQQLPLGDAHLSLSARLLGGKGGFGSMLRAQGGRMNAQKTTNFEACRDLQGRRIRTVNEAKKEKLKRKIDNALKEREPKKHLFDDNQFLQNAEEMVDQVRSAVADAIKRQKTSHTPVAAAASSSKSMFDDDISSSEEEEEEEEDDDEEEEKEEEEKEEEEEEEEEGKKEAEVVVVSDTKGKGKQKA
ncbi:unnamed protein product [Rhizopus stolonifer]